jgi:DNA-binding response OmpR family regulator
MAAATILGVDDNPSNLRLLQAILESQGYVFAGLPSGRVCLELIDQYSPSLVILDIEMPGMNGFETCRRLRSRGVQTPVAFFTSHRSSQDVCDGIAAGGNDFLLKPIEADKLIARVRRWTEATPQPVRTRVRSGLPAGAVLWK